MTQRRNVFSETTARLFLRALVFSSIGFLIQVQVSMAASNSYAYVAEPQKVFGTM